MTWAERFLHTLKENDVSLDQSGTAQTPRDPVFIRQRFMRGLGTGRVSALDG